MTTGGGIRMVQFFEKDGEDHPVVRVTRRYKSRSIDLASFFAEHTIYFVMWDAHAPFRPARLGCCGAHN